jgi:Cu/Ag efflux protein CusF
MTKTIGTGLVALMLLAPVAMAAAPAPGAPMATAAGQIASVDAAGKSLVIKVTVPGGQPQNLNLTVADDSKIIKNGTAVPLSDLKMGDKVTITYRPEDGRNMVVNIGVESKT